MDANPIAAQPAGYERVIMGLYAHNIIIALPLTILAIKIIVRFFTREPAKDIFRSILLLPLDLVYIAFGLIIAAMARRLPTFLAHYPNERESVYGGLLLCGGLFFAACLITWMDRGVRVLWQKFYAAWNLAKNLRSDEQNQIPLPVEQKQPYIKRLSVIVFWICSCIGR